MKASYILIILVVSLQACNQSQASENGGKLKQVSWIVNKWELQLPEGKMSETWQQESDSILVGHGLLISTTGDTLFKEKLRIIHRDDTLYYLPTVANQNDGKEVSFKEKELATNKIIFENLSHDFPQRIVYEKTSDTSILAYVEGMKNGKAVRQDFLYVKTK